jgi:hypothetical protein
VQYESAESAIAAPMNFDWTGSCFFSATVLTTVGYGNFAPTTDGSKWLITIIGIPGMGLFGYCLSQVAAIVLDQVQQIQQAVGARFFKRSTLSQAEQTKEWARIIRKYDDDQSGRLSLEEMIEPVKELEDKLKAEYGCSNYDSIDDDDEMVDEVMVRNPKLSRRQSIIEAENKKREGVIRSKLVPMFDRAHESGHGTNADGEIDLMEGIAILVEIAEKRKKEAKADDAKDGVELITVAVALLLLLGTLIFSQLQRKAGWTALDALYFCMITSTSVGLGDYVPDYLNKFTFFCWLVYVVISMGLVGALISKLGDLSDAAAAMSASANLAVVIPVANLKDIEEMARSLRNDGSSAINSVKKMVREQTSNRQTVVTDVSKNRTAHNGTAQSVGLENGESRPQDLALDPR